ncbi:MAG: cobaltochelatase subunit CobN [Pseudomonadota bacterium]
MHLLAAGAQRIDEGEEAIDLALPPGKTLILSAADGEIAAFVEAAHRTGATDVRLASLAMLTHPMSVDCLAEMAARHAAVIAIRVIGGEAFFAYGIEVFRRLSLAGGPKLLVTAGEPAFDPALAARGTVSVADAEVFHAYCREGGPENRDRALAFLDHLTGAPLPAPPRALPAMGFYHRGSVADAAAPLCPGAPPVGLVFYRAHLVDGLMAGIDGLIEALETAGLSPVALFVPSLKGAEAAEFVDGALAAAGASLVLTTTAFSAGGAKNPLARGGRVVHQVVQAGMAERDWQEAVTGLSVRDLAMNAVTTEFDGRILTRAVAFKSRADRDPVTGAFPVRYTSERRRAAFTAALAARQATLAATPIAGRKTALVLANYPGKGGRIANGVGLDTPASTVAILNALRGAGADVTPPADGAALMAALLACRAVPKITLPLPRYHAFLDGLPADARAALVAEWGAPGADPSVRDGAFRLALLPMGSALVGIQPTRGYERDAKDAYHDPALVPTHAYLAFYLYLREVFCADAVVHVGKHGNMEWLPGKATALSESCWPEIAFGATPHIYPFIVNDPGEGTQAKRRAQGVIVDHLTPPMAEAESYGAAAEIEPLIDEYAMARTLDPRRATLLAREIATLATASGLAADLGLDDEGEAAIAALDAHICDLKTLQIRDGLHVFGQSPDGTLRAETLFQIARATRGAAPEDRSLTDAVALDLGLEPKTLAGDPAAPWEGPRPETLAGGVWRTVGDTRERVAAHARKILGGAAPGPAAAPVVAAMEGVAVALDRSGGDEIAAVLAALRGRAVAPGPSGAPTRGRPDVLPTGRNFFSVDIRGVPTKAAWAIGVRAADAVVARYVMDEGAWPTTLILTCWGTANMRTGGDDLAQGLRFLGTEPVWEGARLTGFRITPLSALGRPRIDVTLRISGFFRDAFPDQITLFDKAVRAVAALDEPADQNPIRVRFADEGDISVFGAMPGAYGAGLQALIETGDWQARADLADAFVSWGQFAYGVGRAGEADPSALTARLARVDALVQAQDNREHDLLDSDDYYQFEGGLAAAVEIAKGAPAKSVHVDTSDGERPVARTLAEEIARVVRGRAANPKWIKGVMRHGYKGAFEIAATVDYLFAFAATTDAVKDHHFDQLFDAYVRNETVAAFIAEANPDALAEIVARFEEAIARQLWHPRANDVHARLSAHKRPEQS